MGTRLRGLRTNWIVRMVCNVIAVLWYGDYIIRHKTQDFQHPSKDPKLLLALCLNFEILGLVVSLDNADLFQNLF